MLEIIKPGLETSIQDYPGRIGYWNQGFPPSGAMDNWSFRLANLLVGNDVGAPGLEAQYMGPTIKFGADAVIDPGKNDVVEAIRDLTHGEGAHKSLDCSSSSEARRAAVQCVRTWGTVCFVGEGGDVTIDVSNDMLRRQVTVVGSWTFSKNGQADCAEFVAERKIDVDALFTHEFKLDEADAAYKLFDTQTTGKGVFLMN